MEVNGDQFSNGRKKTELRHTVLPYCSSGVIQVSYSPDMPSWPKKCYLHHVFSLNLQCRSLAWSHAHLHTVWTVCDEFDWDLMRRGWLDCPKSYGHVTEREIIHFDFNTKKFMLCHMLHFCWCLWRWQTASMMVSRQRHSLPRLGVTNTHVLISRAG